MKKNKEAEKLSETCNNKKICTIGFAGKNLREFIQRLQSAGVARVVDVRLNNTSQLAGYSKKDDLEYVLELVNIKYRHIPALAPSGELMKAFKSKEISWEEYVETYSKMISDQDPAGLVELKEGEKICLLCSEDDPKHCHRRLLAEHLAKKIKGLEVQHL